MEISVITTRIIENASKFSRLEDSQAVPEGTAIYTLKSTNDAMQQYTVKFPKFELEVRTSGFRGYQWLLFLCYRGYCFEPKREGIRIEDYVLTLLNRLKTGNYEWEMKNIIKDCIPQSEYISIMGCIDNDDRKILRQELEEKNKKIAKLVEKGVHIEYLTREISRLQLKLEEIRKITSVP